MTPEGKNQSQANERVRDKQSTKVPAGWLDGVRLSDKRVVWGLWALGQNKYISRALKHMATPRISLISMRKSGQTPGITWTVTETNGNFVCTIYWNTLYTALKRAIDNQ
jgi:hypothetical protein